MTQQGFKAFNKNMENRYGVKFEEGKTYSIPDNLALTAGICGTGFHYTPYLEDTLRYVNGMEEEIIIAKVTASREILTFDDDYYGYFDISATRELTINHILSREEIINHMLNRNNLAIERFIKGYKLTEDEINQIKAKFEHDISVSLAISYYQENDTETYKKFYKRRNNLK